MSIVEILGNELDEYQKKEVINLLVQNHLYFEEDATYEDVIADAKKQDFDLHNLINIFFYTNYLSMKVGEKIANNKD